MEFDVGGKSAGYSAYGEGSLASDLRADECLRRSGTSPIRRPADCEETRFLAVGMELRVRRHVDHPGRYVRDNEVDTDAEDSPTSTPPGQQDAGRDTSAARVPRKRRWREEPEKEQHQESAALTRKRPLHEICSRPKQKARRLLLPASSAETATIATEKGSPSPEKDGTARTAEGSVDHPTPSAEERRPSGQELPRAARMSVPPTHRRLPVDRRPLADVDLCLRIGRESSPTHRQDSPPVQRRKGKEPAEDPPSVQGPSGQGPPAVRSPGYAPKILPLEDDEEGGSTESVSGSGSTEEEEEELVGAPAALCEQVVPLLRYLDRKIEKYADPRQPGSYVELVRRRTRTKVHRSR
ncbi:hypothetical protein AXG93_3673s1010 [Marchantia polymorpha subsp. ruderalis]|uniref:Uncharacterized protein n=1 Tax=Marchantia polymorpha subsp. ruderalis TaxID=1480154 RepID=A0A176VFD4_MARPO|nr:hypothetical protein AXG93_3673s1010 [Marchantia polymorpha subsp. ruderalis]